MLCPVGADFLGQRFYVARVVVVVVDEPQLRQVAGAHAPGVHRIEHAGGGGARVLGVRGQDQHTGDALRFQFIQHLRHGR